MGGAEVKLETAGGLDGVVDEETGAVEHPIGTDAVRVMQAIERAWSDDGVLVLMDLGSAVLSAEMAIELLGDERARADPALRGAARRRRGRSGRHREARHAARAGRGRGSNGARGQDRPSRRRRNGATPSTSPGPTTTTPSSTVLSVDVAHGLHARPAARFVQAAAGFDATVTVRNLTTGRRARRRHEPERGRDARCATGPADRGARVGTRRATSDRRPESAREPPIRRAGRGEGSGGRRGARAGIGRRCRRRWRARRIRGVARHRRRRRAPVPHAGARGARRASERRPGRARDRWRQRWARRRWPSQRSATRSRPAPARTTRASSTRTCCSCATKPCSGRHATAITRPASLRGPRLAGRGRRGGRHVGRDSTTSTCERGRSTCAAWARRCSRASSASRRPRRGSRRRASWWRPISRPPTPRGSTRTRALGIVTAHGGPTSHAAVLARATGHPRGRGRGPSRARARGGLAARRRRHARRGARRAPHPR